MANKFNVTNIMADGIVVEDLTGYMIPTENAVYEILKKAIENKEEVS